MNITSLGWSAQFSIRRDNHQFFARKAAFWSVAKPIQNRLPLFDHSAGRLESFQRPTRICRSSRPAFQLAERKQIANLCFGGKGFFGFPNRSSVGSCRRLGENSRFLDCVHRLFSRQPCGLVVECGNNIRQPLYPHQCSLASWQAHLDSVMVTEQPLSESAVESLDNRLVAVESGNSTLDVRTMSFHRSRDSAHELSTRIDLQQFRPFEVLKKQGTI